MRAYVRTSRRTGISLPFWLALPAVLLWLAVVIVLGLITLVVLLGVLAWHEGRSVWMRRRAKHFHATN